MLVMVTSKVQRQFWAATDFSHVGEVAVLLICRLAAPGAAWSAGLLESKVTHDLLSAGLASALL